MEKNHQTLKSALAKWPAYEPDEASWASLSDKLDEQPLIKAVREMPEYEPDEALWQLIAPNTTVQKPSFSWWYAAATLLLAGATATWFFADKPENGIAFSQEQVDVRLQSDDSQRTDIEYKKLKEYCETETLVCNSQDYRRLQQEYEKLSDASRQLERAIGNYNAEADLIRQFHEVEQQKTDVLNEMAKMI